ncbi:response regulator [Ramlibacter sp. AN1015]|uniref:hybrid sensor histidine kinase/response regulator n=1 Tax=Ramlibacter sp. AN1015 TaxID=3133428 RepID=UPI0030BD0883
MTAHPLAVLLVDDNPHDRALVLREMRKVLPQVRVDEVGGPAELDALLQAGTPWDAAITDYQLRWSTGLDVFRRLQRERPGLPVMLFTASGSEELAVAALQQGVDDYITKTPKHYGRVPYALQAIVERRNRRMEAERAMAALQRSEALLKLATQSASMDVWEIDLASRQLTLHGRASGLIRTDSAHMRFDQLIAAVHPQDQPALRSHLAAAASGVGRFDEEFRLLLQGRIVWVRAAGVPDAGGRIVGVLENVTPRKLAQEQLLLADRQKDQFIATLGHELRNPLAPIRYATRLLDANATPAALASARAVIERQADAMASLLDQLLDLGHISTGRIQLQQALLDLRELVRHAVDDLRPLLDARRLSLTLTLDPQPQWVYADALRIKQVVDNLMHNAMKFTPAGGQVRVSVTAEQHEAVLRAEDTGEGIPADMLTQVFEPFVQVQSGPGSGTRGGLGIGLAVVRQLAKLHGGSVKALSPGAGQGACFEVRLPLAPAGPDAASAPAVPSADGGSAALRILVADDQPDAAESLTMVLSLDGHEVRTAFDGLQAQAIASEWTPEVMVLDIGMPGATGEEVARWARQQPWGQTVRLVAVTGWGRPEDRERLRAAGFDAHLVKPVGVGELWREITRRRN